MADNLFRLSGGLGVDVDPVEGEQVMLQGIGFPLRPIDNTLPEGAPDLSFIIAKGIFISWMGNHQEGLIYPKGSQVRDGTFIMLANEDTIQPAAPVPDGVASFGLPAYAPEAIDPSNISTISCGHTYTFTDEGWIKQLRVWVPALSTASVAYRVIIIDNPLVGEAVTTTISPLILAVDEWVILTFLNNSVSVGDQITITLESLNSAADTVVQGPWIYQGPSQAGGPPPQQWTIDNQRTTMRVNKIDELGADRGTELESVIPETVIQVFEVATPALSAAYRVTSVIDVGTYMNYAVVLVNEAGGGPRTGQSTDITFTIPIPLATEYAEELAFWPAGNPAWATVQSFLIYGETNQNVLDSAFGVDIEFQPASVSADWDIIVSE